MTRAQKQARDAELARLALAGVPCSELAREHNLDRVTVARIVRPALVAAGRHSKQLKRARDREIVRMAVAGQSYKRIAKSLSVSTETAKHIGKAGLRCLGIKRKHRERWKVTESRSES